MHRSFVTSFNAEVVLASFVGFELRTGFAWVAGLWLSRELCGQAIVWVVGLRLIQIFACGSSSTPLVWFVMGRGVTFLSAAMAHVLFSFFLLAFHGRKWAYIVITFVIVEAESNEHIFRALVHRIQSSLD
jgi:hypothetical protein